jgi:hypothetical protein
MQRGKPDRKCKRARMRRNNIIGRRRAEEREAMYVIIPNVTRQKENAEGSGISWIVRTLVLHTYPAGEHRDGGKSRRLREQNGSCSCQSDETERDPESMESMMRYGSTRFNQS